MNKKKFSEAMGEIDSKYIEKAVSYQSKTTPISHIKRRFPIALVAALMVVLTVGAAAAVAILRGDLWFQRPSNNPVEVVRSALENQTGKDYTIKIKIKSVELDEAETERVVERFIKGTIAGWRDWSDEYLAEHFAVVKATYYAEYDHTQTTRSDGDVTMYFYLTQDEDSEEWTIVDNSGNVDWSENISTEENSGTPVGSTKEQLFSYLVEIYTQAYAPYYDGLHYEMKNYEETIDGNEITATFLWTMYYIGKGWDVSTDEGVEQEGNSFLQATVTIDENGVLDFETISVLADSSASGAPDYSLPIEEFFPTQFAD